MSVTTEGATRRVTMSQVYVTGLACAMAFCASNVTGLACGASDVTGLACVMASVRQMSCHVMLKLPLLSVHCGCHTETSYANAPYPMTEMQIFKTVNLAYRMYFECTEVLK